MTHPRFALNSGVLADLDAAVLKLAEAELNAFGQGWVGSATSLRYLPPRYFWPLWDGAIALSNARKAAMARAFL